MGLICVKLRCLLARCCCCHCCCVCCQLVPQQSAVARYKLLLLGASGSGKTQLGHLLSGEERAANDVDATNGVRCYDVKAMSNAAALLLTEVGGNLDMQRLWPHYYAGCHALVYCFDLSASNEQLSASFQLLQRCLQHAAVRGKPVLLIATKHRDGVELYDVEHTFHLEQLARDCGCPLHMCRMSGEDLWQALAWLRRQIEAQAPTMAKRIKYDVNMQSWQRRRNLLLSSGKLAQVHRQRFRRQHRKLWPLPSPDADTNTNADAAATQIRPCTAPAAIFSAHSKTAVN